jgi:AraC-like DNA-binding protein
MMAKPAPGTTSGILNPGAIATKFQLSRHTPAPDIGYFVERYWIVSWDRRGQAPHRQETLPFPSVHLALERGNSRIVGVVRGKFSVLLREQGMVFGIKFRPGGYYPFVSIPISQITDRTIGLAYVFGEDGTALEAAVCAQTEEAKMVEHAEQFLRARLPAPDPQVELINQIVDCVVDDRAIVTVDNLVARFGLTKRTLQRMFSQYVGVSPKWVIMRYRLQEAAEQMAAGAITSWTKLALDLGYFDQPHFIKDFKMIVGQTPAEYARSLRQGL